MKINFRKLNPYSPMALIIGYLFYPFTYNQKIKEDLLPLIKLVHKLFINNVQSTFLAFWYPLIFIGILGQVGSPQFMVFNIASFIPMVVGIQVMPLIILQLKQSSVLKRIGATETKTWHLTASFIFYFTIISILAVALNVGIGSVIYMSSIDFSLINWFQFTVTTIIGILVGLSAGMFLSGIMSDQNTALVVGLLITLPGAFLTGQFLPPNLVNEWGPVRYISFIFPQRIATVLTQTAVNGGSIFSMDTLMGANYTSVQELMDLADDGLITIIVPTNWEGTVEEYLRSIYQFELTNSTELLMAWSLIPVYTFGFVYMTSRTFKWGTR